MPNAVPSVPPVRRRILYVWDADYPWDIRTSKICAALTDAAHEVHLASRNRPRRPVHEQLPEATVHRMKPVPWLPARLDAALGFPFFLNPRWIGHLRSVAVRTHAEVIIVRDLPLCPTAIMVAGRLGVPVVLDMAENYAAMMQANRDAGRQRPWDFLVRSPALVRMVERWCLPRINQVWVVVEESAERVMALGLPKERISVVSNTPPRARADVPLAGAGGSGAPLRLVYLGLMELPRGITCVLDAAHLLQRRGVTVAIDLIGDGRDRALLEQRASDLELGPLVRFHGFIPNTDALAMVSHADVGLIPHVADEAWNTTIPNKLFDYMAAGLPVITSDAKPAARIIRETGAGLVFRSGSAEDLASAVQQLEDPARRERMGRAGQAAIRSRYSWEVAVETIERSLAVMD
jgi:glycosyltransferase involved in cell wall biosynthesis